MVVAVGGHARKVGKTSVVCGIVSSLRAWNWTAIKISPHIHMGAVPASLPDSERYRAAGAKDSYWIQAGEESRLHHILDSAENTIIESNRVLDLVNPDLCLMILDASVEDFKPSARRFLERADAVVLTSPAVPPEGKLSFLALSPDYFSVSLIDFIRLKNSGGAADSTCR